MGKMKSKTVSLLTLGLVCALGVLGSVKFAKQGFETNAATVQTERRVYVYLEGGWDSGNMYIHYWGGASGTTWASCPQMTKVVSDYYQGLFYYDVPVETTDFLVKDSTGDVSKQSNQSDNFLISTIFTGSDYKVFEIDPWVNDSTKRTGTVKDNVPMSSAQAAAVLNNINSCDSSYAEGYNAWPQLNDLFISSSTLEGTTVVTDNYGDSTTIANKCAYIQNRYNIDQAS